ncbi:hypothetical protein Tco_0196378 [Tanacetum coccineum]
MFTPPHRRDQTRYCEFYGDHGHDTNSCVGLRKEIEACIRNGHLSHLAKGQSQSSKAEGIRHPGIKIALSSDEPTPKHSSGEDPLIVKADIGGTMVHRIYVDGGSSAEIMYGHCFDQLYEDQKAIMRPPKTPLSSFSGQLLWPLGVVTLSFKLFDYRRRGGKSIMAEFMVGQALDNFVIECSRNHTHKEAKEATLPPSEDKPPQWTLYTNGASSSEGSGAGLILTDPYEKEVTYAL